MGGKELRSMTITLETNVSESPLMHPNNHIGFLGPLHTCSKKPSLGQTDSQLRLRDSRASAGTHREKMNKEKDEILNNSKFKETTTRIFMVVRQKSHQIFRK